jgi:hypothetical protein
MARRAMFSEAAITRPSQALPKPEPDEVAEDADARRAPARKGKKAIAFWVDPGAAMQLRVTAATMDRTVQNIMEEALDDWFRKHRLTQAAGT